MLVQGSICESSCHIIICFVKKSNEVQRYPTISNSEIPSRQYCCSRLLLPDHVSDISIKHDLNGNVWGVFRDFGNVWGCVRGLWQRMGCIRRLSATYGVYPVHSTTYRVYSETFGNIWVISGYFRHHMRCIRGISRNQDNHHQANRHQAPGICVGFWSETP